MNAHASLGLIEAVAAELRDMLGEDYDDETFTDTLDGETDVIDVIDGILASMQDDDALGAAIKAQEAKLATRRKRIEDRGPAKRRALLRLLDATSMKRMERPLATISRRSGSMSVRIVNADDVPSQLCTVKTTTTPDKGAIKAQLEAGETVPGAEMVRGEDGLTVRIA